MFLKQERPEIDDFERRKKFGCNGKILVKSLKRIPLQNLHKIFVHILLFQNIQGNLLLEKNVFSGAARGFYEYTKKRSFKHFFTFKEIAQMSTLKLGIID